MNEAIRVSDHVLSPFTSAFQAAFSRRETLTVGLSAAVFASVASRLGRAVDLSVKRLSAGQKGTQCPTCGTCMISDAPGAGSRPKKLNCRPCKQKCTANDLCVNYRTSFRLSEHPLLPAREGVLAER